MRQLHIGCRMLGAGCSCLVLVLDFLPPRFGRSGSTELAEILALPRSPCRQFVLGPLVIVLVLSTLPASPEPASLKNL
jgi:hypothetical protein